MAKEALFGRNERSFCHLNLIYGDSETQVEKLRNMKGYNHCAWVKRRETENCGKVCCGIYCKMLVYKNRRGRKVPLPCKICGNGGQSMIQLCRGYGRERERNRESKHRKCFDRVVWQSCFQFHNLIRHLRLLRYTQLQGVEGEDDQLIKTGRSQKLPKISKKGESVMWWSFDLPEPDKKK